MFWSFQTYNCIYCQRVFIDPQDFSSHIKSHIEVMEAAEAKLLNRPLLQQKDVKLPELVYICDLCPQQFRAKHYIDFHMKSHLKLFACENRNLAMHKVNTKKPTKEFRCPECSRVFGAGYRLVRHMNALHLKTEFPCFECEFKGKTNEELKKHIRIHSKAYLRVISVLNNVKDKIF